jgi:hypothetical protein
VCLKSVWTPNIEAVPSTYLTCAAYLVSIGAGTVGSKQVLYSTTCACLLLFVLLHQQYIISMASIIHWCQSVRYACMHPSSMIHACAPSGSALCPSPSAAGQGSSLSVGVSKGDMSRHGARPGSCISRLRASTSCCTHGWMSCRIVLFDWIHRPEQRTPPQASSLLLGRLRNCEKGRVGTVTASE